MLASGGVKKAAHGVELTEVQSEKDHVKSVRVWWVEECDKADTSCSDHGSESPVLQQKTPTHQTSDLHGFFRQRRAATKLKLRIPTYRLSTIFLLIAFVATVLWYFKPSAEDRRSETKLIGTWEVRVTEARSATKRVWFNTASMKYGVRSEDLTRISPFDYGERDT